MRNPAFKRGCLTPVLSLMNIRTVGLMSIGLEKAGLEQKPSSSDGFTNLFKADASDGDANLFCYDFFIICSEIRSANAPMVIAGFGPIAVGTMAPSATYKSG